MFSLCALTTISLASTERVTLPQKETFNTKEVEWFNAEDVASKQKKQTLSSKMATQSVAAGSIWN